MSKSIIKSVWSWHWKKKHRLGHRLSCINYKTTSWLKQSQKKQLQKYKSITEKINYLYPKPSGASPSHQQSLKLDKVPLYATLVPLSHERTCLQRTGEKCGVLSLVTSDQYRTLRADSSDQDNSRLAVSHCTWRGRWIRSLEKVQATISYSYIYIWETTDISVKSYKIGPST